MRLARPVAAAALGLTLFIAGQTASHAFMTPFVLLDRWIQTENKKALATPGHVEWCRKLKPGYRANWNNWRNPDGTVSYCTSPYYSLQFKPYRGN